MTPQPELTLGERPVLSSTMVPGKGGIFEVQIDGKVVAKRAKGHFPDAAEIVAAVAASTKHA